MEKKRVLEVTVDDASWVDKKHRGDYESVPKDELDFNNWWYLHGKLEDLVGYDKAYTTNCRSAGYSKQVINYACIKGGKVRELREDGNLLRYEMHLNGIVPVKVKGVEERCIGYFWTTEWGEAEYDGRLYEIWRQRGFVCLESDKEGREYALSKMRTKADSL